MRKLSIVLCLALVIAAPVFAQGQAEKGAIEIGSAIYKFDDTFMTGVKNAIVAAAAETEAKVDVVDSMNIQATQNEKVDLFITKGVKAMQINPVDRTAAGVIIDKAKKANIPVVFFNREPLAEDMAKWDKIYYVGARAEESGTMSGQIIADYWKANKATMDKNNDGVLQYVMLKGEPGHQDAELRTEYSIKNLKDNGIKVEKLAKIPACGTVLRVRKRWLLSSLHRATRLKLFLQTMMIWLLVLLKLSRLPVISEMENSCRL